MQIVVGGSPKVWLQGSLPPGLERGREGAEGGEAGHGDNSGGLVHSLVWLGLVAACNSSTFRLRVPWGADSGNRNHQNPLYRT